MSDLQLYIKIEISSAANNNRNIGITNSQKLLVLMSLKRFCSLLHNLNSIQGFNEHHFDMEMYRTATTILMVDVGTCHVVFEIALFQKSQCFSNNLERLIFKTC